MPFNNWPYADFQDLNLDWLIRQLKVVGTILKKIESVEKEIPNLLKRLQNYAPLVSPHFAGEPTTPNVDSLDNSDKIANTKFVHDLVDVIDNKFTCHYNADTNTFDSSYAELISKINENKDIECIITCGNSKFYGWVQREHSLDQPEFITIDFITMETNTVIWGGSLQIDSYDTISYYEYSWNTQLATQTNMSDWSVNKTVDANTLKTVFNNKVNISQGVANAGKFLVVGSDGNVTTVTMAEWQGGSY